MRYLEHLHARDTGEAATTSATASMGALPYCLEATPRGSPGGADLLTRTLRALFRAQIETDESPIYGDGYACVIVCICGCVGTSPPHLYSPCS